MVAAMGGSTGWSQTAHGTYRRDDHEDLGDDGEEEGPRHEAREACRVTAQKDHV